MKMLDITRFISRFAVCAAAVVFSACGGQAGLNKQTEAIPAEYHTSCLKRGLAAGTKMHTECVLALYEERRERAVQLGGSVEPPVQPTDGGEVFPPAY